VNLPFVCWTPEAVQSLIAQRYGLQLSVWTVRRYLRRWGIAPERPWRPHEVRLSEREKQVSDLLDFVDDPEGFCRARRVPFSPRMQRVHTAVWGELGKRVAAWESQARRRAWVVRLRITGAGLTVKQAVEEWAACLPVVAGPHYKPLKRMLEIEWLTPPKEPGGTKPWEADLERLDAVLQKIGVPRRKLTLTKEARRQYRYLWALEQVPRPIVSRKKAVLPISRRKVISKGPIIASGLTPRERKALQPVFDQLELSSAWCWGLCPLCRCRFVVRVRRTTFCLPCRAKPRTRRWALRPNPQVVWRVYAVLPTDRARAMTRQQVHAALGKRAPSLEAVSNALRYLRAEGRVQCEGTGKGNHPRRWWVQKRT
jgi:hypothetical protein